MTTVAIIGLAAILCIPLTAYLSIRAFDCTCRRATKKINKAYESFKKKLDI